MIEFVLENYVSMIEGGVIVGLWLVARDRRKAVDRLVDRIDNCTYPPRPDDWREHLKRAIKLEGQRDFGTEQDAPGRVIARSVRRMTKKQGVSE